MSIPPQLRQLVTERDLYRCAYRRTSQHNSGLRLQIDHIVPRSRGGKTGLDNLCLACASCNNHKQARQMAADPASGELVDLYHPLQQEWRAHFAWDETLTVILGLTPCGRATVEALNMNNDPVVWARRRWVEAGWHPPS
jgi:hypothetical protein